MLVHTGIPCGVVVVVGVVEQDQDQLVDLSKAFSSSFLCEESSLPLTPGRTHWVGRVWTPTS